MEQGQIWNIVPGPLYGDKTGTQKPVQPDRHCGLEMIVLHASETQTSGKATASQGRRRCSGRR